MAKLEVRPSDGAIGAEITGADLTVPVGDDDFATIEDAVNRYAVIVVRDQILTGAQLAAFARRFGQPQINVRAEANDAEVPEVFFVSNVTKDGKPLGSHDAGRYWHSDLCYLEKPSTVTLLNAIEVPEKDGVTYGDTLFAGSAVAYDALPDEMKQRLDGLKAANGYRNMWNRKAREFGARPVLSDEELEARYPPDAYHPIIRTHPTTGRKCLFVCEGYTYRIEGIPEAESESLLRQLFEHAVKPEFQYRHKWRRGDLLMWDNCAVQHKASFDYPPSLRRVMQRCTIEGEAPF
ncbi:MAG: TauD/TfdA family dioxygenase [Alphaproteobacteria bacterium]|nr:TauD/TfdA family dioxygenase [Alphaproteobacteria bacterium]